MKITIERSTLLDRLTQVAKAIDNKSAILILEGVLLQSDAELTLTGSDSTFSITTTLDDYSEHEAGAAVIPARRLLEVIRKMPEKEISIETDDKSATIKCGSTKVTLPVMDAEEYPSKNQPLKDSIEMDGNEFTNLVDITTFAVSQNEGTPILQGVSLKMENDMITATATDRHRLARHISKTGSEANGQYIVPTKILETVSKLKPSNVEIWLSEERIGIKAREYQFSSALLDGSYPDTSKIIPTSGTIVVKVNTEMLLRTLELAEKVNEEKTKVARLEISAGQLFISAKDGASGMEETLEAEVDGDDITVSANAKYMIDALKTISTAQTEIWFTGTMSPVIIKPTDNEQSLHLVLPYRTQGG